MIRSVALAATAAYLLLNPAAAAGLYTKGSPVLQVDSTNYDRLITKSNYTSIVEFYAPWCGHCQSLKPAYEKAAKSLDGLAKVASVNCDAEENRPLCARFDVKGFPTLKIIKPSKKPGKPTVEDYQGPRTAKGITDIVVDKIPNHVTRVKDNELDGWLDQDNSTAKAILFTEKGTTSALLRALAIDFLGSINVAQIRNKEEKAVEAFGIAKFPKLVLLPGGDKESLVYDGEMKKEPISKFLSQVATPNPDPAPAPEKAKKPKKASKAKSTESDSSEEEIPHDKPQKPIIPDEATEEASSAPLVVAGAPEIPEAQAGADLQAACLSTKSKVCVLALLNQNSDGDESASQLLGSLSDIAFKHVQRKAKIFPFYSVPYGEEQEKLREQLGLKPSSDLDLIATNGKRSWLKRYGGENYGVMAVETWIDAIRMGEGKKEKFPEGVIGVETVEPEPEAHQEESQPIIDDQENPLKVEIVEEIIEETSQHDEL
ncbi:hypothetical protein P152DRAFT_462777 [Eremomyces bilateralis CBS 781.70]|uniref:protein disulfide-isomerase n=1 Tax=Eremomyces bilateralis CBS 781.70 TaxID=1392243 RepID=A0A6G1FR05_9PEZI|nr:uncharacterized protein P152DRAFT_462777 [Eremomyces bilateralis CBS 781.70]KAF1808203.1 hypothetical protein P152DRAFT_462777 [Eremomyces bilateralis CBS 781.70]